MSRFNDRYRDSFGKKVHGDPSPHGARANHANFVDGNRLCVSRDIRDFISLSFRKEIVALSLGFDSTDEDIETLSFCLYAFVERFGKSILYTLDDGFRRIETTGLPRNRFSESIKEGRVVFRILQFFVGFSYFDKWTAFRCYFFGESHTPFE